MFAFPNFNVPPPQAPNTLSLRQEADLQIHNFLSTRNLNKPSNEWNISKFKATIHRIDYLKTQIRENLASEEQKEELSVLLQLVNNQEVLNNIKKKINRRKVKRSWIKRRKIQFRDQLKQREDKHKIIDENIRKLQTEATQERRIIEGKQEVDKVLSDAKKRLNHAKQQLELCESLYELRRLRKTQSSQEIDDSEFYSSITDLKEVWQKALEKYQKVYEDLESYVLQEFNYKQFVENQWNEVLFGEKTGFKVEKKWENLVAIRSAWDLCIDSEGTAIPSFWVVPNSNPNEEWKEYLETNS